MSKNLAYMHAGIIVDRHRGNGHPLGMAIGLFLCLHCNTSQGVISKPLA
jgi:hypothetical protein